MGLEDCKVESYRVSVDSEVSTSSSARPSMESPPPTAQSKHSSLFEAVRPSRLGAYLSGNGQEPSLPDSSHPSPTTPPPTYASWLSTSACQVGTWCRAHPGVLSTAALAVGVGSYLLIATKQRSR